MDNSSNTTARLGAFVFIMTVFGIVLLIATIIDQSSKQPIYLPMVVRPTTLAGSQAIYPGPVTYQAGSYAHLETGNPRLHTMKLYQPRMTNGFIRQWI